MINNTNKILWSYLDEYGVPVSEEVLRVAAKISAHGGPTI